MKNRAFIIFVMCLLLTGCGESFSISKDKVESMDIQFKEQIVTVESDELNNIINILNESKLEGDDNSKGWIYRMVFRDVDDKIQYDIKVIEDGYIINEGKKYKCSGISINELDKISGIKRE